MLKPVFIKARDLPDAWFRCLWEILDYGHKYTVDRGSYEGQQRLEFDYITIQITHPGTRPLLPDIPPACGIPNPVADDYMDEYLPYLMTNAKAPGEDYTYGERLAGWNGVNQIDEVIEMYKKQGYGTNQAAMSIAIPTDIVLGDPPCLRHVDTRIKDGKLHFMVYFRSWDLWGGFSANLAGLQLMKEYMAAEIGVEDGEIIASSKGMHLYDYSWNLAELRTYKECTI